MKKISFLLAIFLLISTAFCGCSGYETAQPDSSSKIQEVAVTDFKYELREGCVYLTKYIGTETDELVIPDTIEGLPVSVIRCGVFRENTLKSIVIPASVRYIDELAFNNCAELEKVSVLGSDCHFRLSAFSSCENLKDVVFSGNAPTIKFPKVFKNCHKELKIYYNKNTSGWENCPLAEDYTLVAQ